MCVGWRMEEYGWDFETYAMLLVLDLSKLSIETFAPRPPRQIRYTEKKKTR